MLLTEWQTLATAGATIDGREIREQWLKEIAETYDREKYTAIINADHERWYGNFGHVHEVRLGKSKDGKTTLEGRLAPNFRLVEMNRNGQRLFASIEVTPNFAGEGKAYLGGLAVTDQPASLGTSMLKFSAKDAIHSEPQSFALAIPGEESETESETKGLLQKLLSAIKGTEFKTQPETPAPDQQGTAMTPEQFEALKDQNEKIIAGLGGLAEAFKAQQPAPATEQEPVTEPETVTAEQFKELQQKLDAMTEEFNKLKTEPAAGTQVPANGGAADEIEFI